MAENTTYQRYIDVAESSQDENDVRLAMVNLLATMFSEIPIDDHLLNEQNVQLLILTTYYYIYCLIDRKIFEILSNWNEDDFTNTNYRNYLTAPDDDTITKITKSLWIALA